MKRRGTSGNSPWEPALAFLRRSRLSISFAELRQLNTFLKLGQSPTRLVPIKERSLQIFGDEKRLDAYCFRPLFRPGRLDLRKTLCCEVVGEPLPGSADPPGPPRNRSSSLRTRRHGIPIAAGTRTRTFQRGHLWLRQPFRGRRALSGWIIFTELRWHAPHVILWRPGSARVADSTGSVESRPGRRLACHRGASVELSRVADGSVLDADKPWEGEPPSTTLCDWLGDCACPVRQTFRGWQTPRARTRRLGVSSGSNGNY